MRIHTLLFAALAAAGCLALSAAASDVLVDQNAKHTDAFVLMQAEMTDQAAFFTKYAIPAEVTISANGGNAQVATFGKTVLEGVWDNNWTIMLRFPSLQTASTWYHSPAYQAVIPFRHAATAYGNMVLFEGTPESVLRWQVSRYDDVSAQLRFPLTLDPTPEYIVTAVPAWSANDGRFAVSADFAETDVHRAELAVELKLPAAYVSDGRLQVNVALRDAAGRHHKLGGVRARQMKADQWYALELEAGGRGGRHDDGDIDLSKVTAVEFDVLANGKPAPVGGDIQIRNLTLRR